MKDKRKIIRRRTDTLPLLLQGALDNFKKDIMERMDQQDKKIQPVVDAFTGLNWSKTALIWIVSLIGSVTAIVLGLKEIYKK